MRIAIPTFGDRVSPRFDCARTLLFVEVDDSQPVDRRELVAAAWAPHERINKLVELGVDIVICGGIDCWSAQSLQSAGIDTYGWVTGMAEDALARLLRGELTPSAAMPPGPAGGGPGGRRRGGPGGGRGRGGGHGRGGRRFR